MDTYENADDDQFHALIRSASPRVAESDEHTRRLLQEVADGVRGASSDRPRRRVKIAAAIVAPLLVLGSASAAYAATGGWSWYWDMSKSKADAGEVEPWLPAAQNPDARVTYSLPGGGTCELRLWGFTFSPQADAPEGVAFDPRSAKLARDFAATADIAALMDIPSVIAENRSDENWGPDENGLLTRYGYGTDRYDEDVEYHSAAQEAISDVIVGHLDSLGVPSNGMGWEGQEICAGVDE